MPRLFSIRRRHRSPPFRRLHHVDISIRHSAAFFHIFTPDYSRRYSMITTAPVIGYGSNIVVSINKYEQHTGIQWWSAVNNNTLMFFFFASSLMFATTLICFRHDFATYAPLYFAERQQRTRFHFCQPHTPLPSLIFLPPPLLMLIFSPHAIFAFF